MSASPALLTGYYKGSRRTGFSLREMLISQGVTSESALRSHITFVAETLKENPDFEPSTYRVNPNYPNDPNPVMG